MKFSEIKECPFCGSDKYYVSEYYYGKFEFTQSFREEECDNSGMYDGLQVRTNKRAYCKECENYLGNIINNTVGKEAEKALNYMKQGESQ